MGSRFNLIAILGHTAGGKTAVAANLAYRLGGEVISADSRQVYRGMDIGTGKDYGDYLVEDQKVPFHLIDIVDAGYEYNLFEFQQNFISAFGKITGAGRIPVLCGGTGLYIESVIRNYQLLNVPVNEGLRKELEKLDHDELEKMLRQYGPLHNITDTESRKRLIRAIEIAEYQSGQVVESSSFPDMDALVIGISYHREARRRRITERLRARLDQGMIGEVERLLDSGIDHDKLRYYGLEYKYISMYLQGELSYDDMFEGLNSAIHRFAKRQMTYFRGMERRGIKIHWLAGEMSLDEKTDSIESLYRSR